MTHMAPENVKGTRNSVNKGAWTPEEDRKLAQFIEIHGAKKWKIVAAKAGLNRCGKSCRLRWLNYLRPNIKKGSFSEQEEDLILRLHKLLGNRWSLIAGRLPGRTDNDIKNHWNAHLSKKINQKERPVPGSSSITQISEPQKSWGTVEVKEESKIGGWNLDTSFDVDDLFDFSTEGSLNLDWVNNFLELDGNLGFQEI